MARDIEIVSVSSLIGNSTFPVPTYDAQLRSVVGTTADGATSTVPSLQGWLKQNQYFAATGASTHLLSTAAVIRSINIIPVTSAAGTFQLLDGTTALFTVPTAAYVPQPNPISLDFGAHGIRSATTVGFKIVCGASVTAIVSGAFASAPTTA
jgi:hypothetical protein